MDTLIYHSNCEDGFCAAMLFSWVYPEAELIPWNYYFDNLDSLIERITGKDVLVADFSFDRSVMLEMASKAKSIKVLDHHKTARTKLEGLDFCVFDMTKSGARLTWEFLYEKLAEKMGNTSIVCGQYGFVGDHTRLLSFENPHWMVQYVEDRDLWKHKLPHTHAINMYIRSFPMDMEVWNQLAKQEPAQFVLAGEALLRYRDVQVNRHAKYAFDVMIDGRFGKACQCTSGDLYSDLGHLLGDDIDFAAIWSDVFIDRSNTIWKSVSLRSRDDKPPILPICEKFGGGGHDHAANFKMLASEVGGEKFEIIRLDWNDDEYFAAAFTQFGAYYIDKLNKYWAFGPEKFTYELLTDAYDQTHAHYLKLRKENACLSAIF